RGARPALRDHGRREHDPGALDGRAATDVPRRHWRHRRGPLHAGRRLRVDEPGGQALERVPSAGRRAPAVGDVPLADPRRGVVISTLGFGTIAVALALSVYGAVAAVVGVRTRRPELVQSASVAAYVNFALLAIANLAMVYALVVHDFSVSYVAQVGSRSTPLFITIISLWSALEGSILFWGLVLAAYTAAAVYVHRNHPGP